MSIRRFWRKTAAHGWKFDRDKQLWWSWGFDLRPEGRSGSRQRENGFPTQAAAEAAAARVTLARKEEKYGFTRVASPTLASLVARHLAKITKKNEKTRSTRVLTDWLELLPLQQKITDTDTSDIVRYVDKRFVDEVGPSTIDRELNIISACLNAVDLHYPGNEYRTLRQWRPPRIPRPEYSKQRRQRVLQADEYDRLLKYLSGPRMDGEQLQTAVARNRIAKKMQFAFLVGCRHSEMLGIKKIHVDWKRRSVRIKGTKSDASDRVINPLPDTAFAILEEAAAHSKTEWVFGSPTPNSKFYRLFRESCEAVGIIYGRNVADGFVLHDARHTVTTLLLQEGIDPATVQEQMGWSRQEFLLYYSHATQGSRTRAASAMERLTGDARQLEPLEAPEINTVQ